MSNSPEMLVLSFSNQLLLANSRVSKLVLPPAKNLQSNVKPSSALSQLKEESAVSVL
ncbi:hypothetical protein L208DRAFT_1403623 [Tricholoma matsutake]|nr:hypothetical protein L208DRAFT_1403623 [Tricholoma matsutake 945]